MSHIFISYSKQDIDFVRYLRALLEKEGFVVWVDEARLTPSVRWWKTIEENIDSCSAFVIVMSPNATESDWVEREILLAEGRKRPIFPVLLAGDPWSRLANIQYEDMRAGLRGKLSARFLGSLKRVVKPRESAQRSITLTVEWGDITETAADVVALKYAQAFYGADRVVAEKLEVMTEGGYVLRDLKLASGAGLLLNGEGAISARNALFVGTPRLRELYYPGIRAFAHDTLLNLRDKAPATRHLAMTIHGPGFGRDEIEALRSQIEGYKDALRADDLPPALERITIVEFSEGRVGRLRATLDSDFANDPHARRLEAGWGYELTASPAVDEAKAASIIPAKPHAFVIMPLNGGLDDVFFYGIQTPIHALGLLCERVEAEAMTADLVEQIKERIGAAAVVVADITQTDAAVYMQLGYAWGKGRPTLVLAKKGTAPVFDMPQTFSYTLIKQCEEWLAAALADLKAEGKLKL